MQFKEMGGSRRPSESLRTNEQPTEKKRGFGDWMNLIKPADEEKVAAVAVCLEGMMLNWF